MTHNFCVNHTHTLTPTEVYLSELAESSFNAFGYAAKWRSRFHSHPFPPPFHSHTSASPMWGHCVCAFLSCIHCDSNLYLSHPVRFFLKFLAERPKIKWAQWAYKSTNHRHLIVVTVILTVLNMKMESSAINKHTKNNRTRTTKFITSNMRSSTPN